MSQKPKVAVVGTGGTISTRSSLGPLDLVDYMISGATLSTEEVLQAVPEAANFADLIPLHFRAVSSTAMDFDAWNSMAAAVERIVADDPGIAGVVILHGPPPWKKQRICCT